MVWNSFSPSIFSLHIYHSCLSPETFVSHHTLTEKSFNDSSGPAEWIPNFNSKYSLSLFFTYKFISHPFLIYILHSRLIWPLIISYTHLAFGICCPCFCSCCISALPSQPRPHLLKSLSPSNIFKNPLIPHLKYSLYLMKICSNVENTLIVYYTMPSIQGTIRLQTFEGQRWTSVSWYLTMPYSLWTLNMLLLNNYSLGELINEWLMNPN